MESEVYFTRDITPEKVVEAYSRLGIDLPGKVAVKVHSGEKGNQNFLRPGFWKPMVDRVHGTIVECNTAYSGNRSNTESHRRAIAERGFTEIAPVDIMDEEGNLFIKGRSKNMLLGANGQNIYPEEIEDLLNNMTLVNESIVIQKGDKLYGLVYPDFEEAEKLGLQINDLAGVMEQNRTELNAALPSYAHLSGIKIYNEEFEKTPKRSIKRFLYADAEI